MGFTPERYALIAKDLANVCGAFRSGSSFQPLTPKEMDDTPWRGKTKKKTYAKKTPHAYEPNTCLATTRQGRRCPIEAGAAGLCHVHDPNGKFRQQQREKRRRNRGTV